MPTTTPPTRRQSQHAKRPKAAKVQKTTRARRRAQEASDSLASKRNGVAVAADGKPEVKQRGPSLRQLLRRGKESGQVDGAQLLQALPEKILKSQERLEEVVALFARHSVVLQNWEPPVVTRKPETRRRSNGED